MAEELEVTGDALRIRCTFLSEEAVKSGVKTKIEGREYVVRLKTAFRFDWLHNLPDPFTTG